MTTPHSIKLLPSVIIVDGCHVMEASRFLKAREVEIAAQASGRVLEVGFGLGLCHAALHENNDVTTIDVVELYPEIAKRYKSCPCTLFFGDYTKWRSDANYDTIILDVAGAVVTSHLWEALAPGGVILWHQLPAEGGTPVLRRLTHGDRDSLGTAE